MMFLSPVFMGMTFAVFVVYGVAADIFGGVLSALLRCNGGCAAVLLVCLLALALNSR
jgi:hypothetical protein